MNLFFDTSVLVKLFHREAGSGAVERLHSENDISVSELALTEFYSATLRKYREKLINDHQLREIFQAFDEQMSCIQIEPLSSAVIGESKDILHRNGKKLPIRSLDALQLATYQLIADETWTFVATDSHLLGLARHLGLKILNPCASE